MADKSYPKWTEQEIDYLRKNCQNEHASEIAKKLNRTYGAVINKLYEHRLSTKGRELKNVKARVYQKVQKCKLPVFHPVMVGIYPVTNQSGSNSIWSKRRLIILKMHDYCCAYCGDEANTVDHVIALNNGGTDDINNLVAACKACNYGFSDRPKYIEFKIGVI